MKLKTFRLEDVTLPPPPHKVILLPTHRTRQYRASPVPYQTVSHLTVHYWVLLHNVAAHNVNVTGRVCYLT
jgi:hypothetical protein